MPQIKLNIWQLFILILMIFFAINIQAKERAYPRSSHIPKAKYEWVKGKGVEVCELYLQNLLKFYHAPKFYPHKIHPDFADQLIHPPFKNWHRLGRDEYKLLYVRLHSFLRFDYQYYSDSGEEEEMRHWSWRRLYTLDLDINNDGQTEAVLGFVSANGHVLNKIFVVANLDEQSIDETLSYHLLWPRALLIEQAIGEPPRLELSMTELDNLITAAKENTLSNKRLAHLLIKLETKNYTREQMLDMFKNRIYFSSISSYIQDDFFIYDGKTYVTRGFSALSIFPPESLFRIYKTEHDKTTEVCVYHWYR